MPCVVGMAPTLDIHVDNGVPGEDVIAMRISLNPSGQPSISEGSNSSIEDMLKEMLSQGVEVPGGEVRIWSCDCSTFNYSNPYLTSGQLATRLQPDSATSTPEVIGPQVVWTLL